MMTPGEHKTVSSASPRIEQGLWKYSLVIALAIVMAYSNSFFVPFIFDDQNITQNSSIRTLSSISNIMAPPFGIGIAGRPILNLSLALNYAISGTNPWSYHLLNLMIHLSAALCLFGIVRRSFLTKRLEKTYGYMSTPLAFACALIWALHPLQTQAVTYTIQRCESLMGLCFLLTFYFAVRGWQSPAPRGLHMAAILCFLVGVGVKEVIVVAPALLIVYDILFFHGRLKDAFRRSWVLYAGLPIGLVALGLLVAAGGTTSSGSGKMTFTASDYWITQPEVILHYLRLAFWPASLSIDYGWPAAKLRDAWPFICILSLLLVFSLWALGKRHPIGFPAVWFFAVLAPTSLMPLPDAAFEHRMYLPSMALVVITLTCVYRVLRYAANRWSQNDALGIVIARKGAFYLLIIAALSLGILTHARNADYGSSFSIWADAVRKYPNNSRAHLNLGVALAEQGDYRGAFYHYGEALRINPNYLLAKTNLGDALMKTGRIDDALKIFREVLKAQPQYGPARRSLADALFRKGEIPESILIYKMILLNEPDNPEVYNNLGVALAGIKMSKEAARCFEAALQIRPNYTDARNNLTAVKKMGHPER